MLVMSAGAKLTTQAGDCSKLFDKMPILRVGAELFFLRLDVL